MKTLAALPLALTVVPPPQVGNKQSRSGRLPTPRHLGQFPPITFEPSSLRVHLPLSRSAAVINDYGGRIVLLCPDRGDAYGGPNKPSNLRPLDSILFLPSTVLVLSRLEPSSWEGCLQSSWWPDWWRLDFQISELDGGGGLYYGREVFTIRLPSSRSIAARWCSPKSGDRHHASSSLGWSWPLEALKSSCLMEALEVRKILLQFARAETRGVRPRSEGLETSNFASRRTGGGTPCIVPDNGVFPMGMPTSWRFGRLPAILVEREACWWVLGLLGLLVLKSSFGLESLGSGMSIGSLYPFFN
ncbi:hypothetical protein RchiOBHm_Chr1g0355701 [Rosa chinensis]|uniref:Uncharacterized protein n=1 Tax=Rosa chinensis TaxID=74649 RepID=A0A2P6SHF1_ROSCH|nr:uncharacterized protein LOC121052208 [Rosa chinensis]PRQ58115.1 hypothetical protein RchiOBHm_Chr1g0355701 [Rosa chinensis]